MPAIQSLPDIIVPGRVTVLLVKPGDREFALTRLLSCQPSDLHHMHPGENHMLSSRGPVCVVDYSAMLAESGYHTPINIQQYLLHLPKNAHAWNYPHVLVQDYTLQEGIPIQQRLSPSDVRTTPGVSVMMTY